MPRDFPDDHATYREERRTFCCEAAHRNPQILRSRSSIAGVNTMTGEMRMPPGERSGRRPLA
jgi:hypothetical protein